MYVGTIIVILTGLNGNNHATSHSKSHESSDSLKALLFTYTNIGQTVYRNAVSLLTTQTHTKDSMYKIILCEMCFSIFSLTGEYTVLNVKKNSSLKRRQTHTSQQPSLTINSDTSTVSHKSTEAQQK